MQKYKAYFTKMMDENKELFENFKKLHHEYEINQKELQSKFNEDGEKILEIIRDYENRLCANTERGMYNKFSAGLAEKFQNEVRKHFSMIDYIGLKPEQDEKREDTGNFFLKKISLNE